MARPSTPLINKEKTLQVALKIVDNEGLSALSIRRLGKELNINGYSLYHHFENKDGILVGLCEHVLGQVERSEQLDKPWQDWMLESTLNSYETISQHPNLVPAILKYNLLGIQQKASDQISQILTTQGVPAKAILPLIEGLTVLIAGFVSLEPLENVFNKHDALDVKAPSIFELGTTIGFVPRQQLLELTAKSFIKGIEEQYVIS